MRIRLLVSCVLVALVALPVRAQFGWLSSHGVVTGTVTDAQGQVMPGTTVTLAADVPRTEVTDERGVYRFERVAPGVYTVTAALAGFETWRRQVRVEAGLTTTLAIAMVVGSLQETITVTAESPLINASGSNVDSGDRYDFVEGQGFRRVSASPLSTFSIDVDTASYANVRRFLNDGQLPPPGAVRIEELVNYFRFDYAPPRGDAPFGVTTELSGCPWNGRHQLALIGVKGRELPAGDLPVRNLVFLLDVSGSMADDDKLPLVKRAMRELVDSLTDRDRVAIVVYAGASGLALPTTSGADKPSIHRALARLHAGGSTNGGQGIQLAYSVARKSFVDGGVNRVILATDGDFNVGMTSDDALVRLIEEERKSGVFLSVLGVGEGNLNDAMMEQLADRGNGNYSYLDSLAEARKVLIAEANGTFVTIAKDVKIQVEFNPAVVAAYRLVGYENRMLAAEDFTDDAKDAGDIGAGHTVTALYEIVPVGVEVPAGRIEPLRYQRRVEAPGRLTNEALTVNVRYKAPDGDASRLVRASVANRVTTMGPNMGFASAVAEFGLVLRGAAGEERVSLEAAARRARRFLGPDVGGYRAEFVTLTDKAERLSRIVSR